MYKNGYAQKLILLRRSVEKKLDFFAKLKQKSFFIAVPIFSFFQYLIYIGCQNVFYFLLNVKIIGIKNLTQIKRGGILIAANHHGAWDPFLIGSAVPRNHYKVMSCLRFFTYYKYIYFKLYGPLLWCSGAYSVHPHTGQSYAVTLKTTVDILKNNQSVVMFPTGKRELKFHPHSAKPGAGYLVKEHKPTIIPVAITNTHNISLKDLLYRRRNVSIIFGKPFQYDDFANEKDEYRDISIKILERVKELEESENR